MINLFFTIILNIEILFQVIFKEYIRLGKNKMEIFIYDNIGNKNIISGVFEIVE